MRKVLVTTFLLLFLVIVLNVPTSLAQTDTGQHCVLRLAPIQANETESKVLGLDCFDTFAEALSWASGGQFEVGPEFQPGDLTNEMIEGIGVNPQGLRTLAYFWDGQNFTGDSLVVQGSEDCIGFSYGSNMPSAFDNRAESSESYWTCYYIDHYDLAGFTGDSYYGGQKNGSLWWMNNRTTSFRLHS